MFMLYTCILYLYLLVFRSILSVCMSFYVFLDSVFLCHSLVLLLSLCSITSVLYYIYFIYDIYLRELVSSRKISIDKKMCFATYSQKSKLTKTKCLVNFALLNQFGNIIVDTSVVFHCCSQGVLPDIIEYDNR